MHFLTEVRLHPGSACRAWTDETGCLSAREWEESVSGFAFFRGTFEAARLRISEALSVEGVDPSGVVRKLLVHESSASLSRAGYREVGFVHLEAASGIHLYALARAYEALAGKFAGRWTGNPAVIRGLQTVPPLAIWLAVFGLSGFRPGLLRPLVLVLCRWLAKRFGLRWARATPIFLALAFDAGVGFVASFGTNRTFAEWAPGEIHYAAAWWGGILGFDWAKRRGYGTFATHAALSVASWLAVLPLDLADGRFAPATPLLSLLTVEFLVRGGYLTLFGGGILVGFVGGDSARAALQWASFLINQAVGVSFAKLIEWGALRSVSEDGMKVVISGTVLAAIGGASVWYGYGSRPGKPAKS